MVWLSFLAGTLGLLGAAGAYFGYVDFAFAFYLVLFALAVLSLHLPLFLVKFIRRGRRDVSFLALLFGILSVAALGFLFKLVIENPIRDVTTDLGNPPRFEHRSPVFRAPGQEDFIDNSWLIDKTYEAENAEKQKRAYPDIRRIYLSAPPAGVFSFVTGVIEKHRPDLRAVRKDIATNTAEYEATVPYLHALDDVILQVRPADSGAEVVIRSRSRLGPSDFGFNARRVRELSSLIQTNAVAAVPPIPVGAPQ